MLAVGILLVFVLLLGAAALGLGVLIDGRLGDIAKAIDRQTAVLDDDGSDDEGPEGESLPTPPPPEKPAEPEKPVGTVLAAPCRCRACIAQTLTHSQVKGPVTVPEGMRFGAVRRGQA